MILWQKLNFFMIWIIYQYKFNACSHGLYDWNVQNVNCSRTILCWHEKNIFWTTCTNLFISSLNHVPLPSIPAHDLKNSRKYGLDLSCRWALITTWAFAFNLHLILDKVKFKKPVYLADFYGRNGAFQFFLWEQDSTLSLILY